MSRILCPAAAHAPRRGGGDLDPLLPPMSSVVEDCFVILLPKVYQRCLFTLSEIAVSTVLNHVVGTLSGAYADGLAAMDSKTTGADEVPWMSTSPE